MNQDTGPLLVKSAPAGERPSNELRGGRAEMRFRYAHGDRPIDGYTIQRGVGVGGFGEVYEAVNDAGKVVAIKAIRGDRFEVELRGVRQCINLKHPNLIEIYDIKSSDDGDHFVIMEYVAGESLANVIDKNPNGMPLPEIAEWFRGIAAAVGYLHEHGIVHRDLKPQNIFREDGFVKVGDYGLSKHITVSDRSGHTAAVGTVHYMAPEVGSGRYGRSIDIFAVGVLLYEMLTGRLPFDGESVGEVLMRIATEEPDLSTVPAELRPVLDRALKKDPEQRYKSMDEFRSEFDAAVSSMLSIGPRKRPLVPPRREPRERPSSTAGGKLWASDVSRTLLEAAGVAVALALMFRLVTAAAGSTWGVIILFVTLVIYLQRLRNPSSGPPSQRPPNETAPASEPSPQQRPEESASPPSREAGEHGPTGGDAGETIREQHAIKGGLRTRLAHWAWITLVSPFFAILGAAAAYLVTGAPADAGYVGFWLAGATSLTAALSVIPNWNGTDRVFRFAVFWLAGAVLGALIPTHQLVLDARGSPPAWWHMTAHRQTVSRDYSRWWYTHRTEHCLLRVPRLELFPDTPIGSHLALALAFATPFACVPWPRILNVGRRSRVPVFPLLGAILFGYIWLALLDAFVSTGFEQLASVLYLLLLLGLVSSLASPYRPDLHRERKHSRKRVP